MHELAWNWWCVPYLLASVLMIAVGVAATLTRGDRVLRIGVVGAVAASVPWAVTSAVEACVRSPSDAAAILRVGNGPIALLGPSVLVVLLGASGQLERRRWLARVSGVVGLAGMAMCWSTDWVVAGAHPVGGGLLYMTGGPLIVLHISQLGIWAVIGLVLARRSALGLERRGVMRLLIAMLALGAVGASDLRLASGRGTGVPIAWAPVLVACGIALYLVLRTDLLRPHGVDRNKVVELVGYALAGLALTAAAAELHHISPIALATIGAGVWVIATAVAWNVARRRPLRVGGERRLTAFVAQIGEVTDVPRIARELGGLWQSIAVELRAAWTADPADRTRLRRIGGDGASWQLAEPLVAWLVRYAEPFSVADLATMRLGAVRPLLDALTAAHGASLLVPLVDRDALVGLVEASHLRALREAEGHLIAESARAAARALTYVELADAAARDGATAREVELAQAMRLAAVRRDDELDRWLIGAAYRSALRTTGAAWSAVVLADGRLALLVTEAQAHGIAAALATAAVTGAFAALTAGAAPSLDALLADLGASATGVVRGGERIAAFLGLFDPHLDVLEWAAAGHRGAHLIGGGSGEPIALGGEVGGNAVLRGNTVLSGATLIVASRGLHGDDPERWARELATLAPTSPRLAAQLLAGAADIAEPSADLLAVVVRDRGAA